MRGKLEADTLLTIVLVLVAIWLVLAIIQETLGLLGSLFGLLPFSGLIGLIIALLIVLWLLDAI